MKYVSDEHKKNYKDITQENNFNVDEIEKIIVDDDNIEDLVSVVFSLGRDCQNETEFEYAFNHLKNLSKHKDSSVRAFVALSFSMMVQNGYKIDRKILEPLILDIYKKTEEKDIGNVTDAIDDINFFTNWNIKF